MKGQRYSKPTLEDGARRRFFDRAEQLESARREGKRAAKASRFLAAIVLVGVLGAAFAVVFRGAVSFVLNHAYHARDLVMAMQQLPTWARVVIPALGGLCAGAVGLLSSRGQVGVGNVMEAVVLGRVHLSTRTTLVKSFASWLAIVSGGSLGREGPLIQFGGAGGALIGRRLRMTPREIRSLIAAGSAAGFAAAYNTPFAAVLFVVEVVAGVVVLDAVAPALIATAIATALTRVVIGAGPVYGARAFTMIGIAELFSFLGLGIITAAVSLLFMRMLAVTEEQFRKRLPQPWRAAVGASIAGCIITALPFVAGNGFEPLNILLDGHLGAELAAIVLIGKMVATCAQVSSGSPGGVFTPTMLIGGTTGYLFAIAVSSLGAHIGIPEGYALVGVAAAVAATTHAPMTAAVLAFELSGDYAIALPLVFATAVATLISRAAQRDSIYTRELTARGVGWDVTFDKGIVERTLP